MQPSTKVGGFQADASEVPPAPLPVHYSEDLEAPHESVETAGGII